jgi:hypothetical protein
MQKLWVKQLIEFLADLSMHGNRSHEVELVVIVTAQVTRLCGPSLDLYWIWTHTLSRYYSSGSMDMSITGMEE